MDPENIVLNLGSQAAVALTVLSIARQALPAPERIPATPCSSAKSAGGGQLWSDMKQRWLPASGHGG